MQEISKAVRQLMIKYPYYGYFAYGLNKKYTDELPTLAIGLEGINYILYINKDFWKGLSLDHKVSAIQHELLHSCLFHLTNMEKFLHRCGGDHSLCNIAMDLEVESYIDPDSWIRDKDGNLIGTADALFTKSPDLPKGQGTHFYIEFLQQLRNKLQMPGSSNNQSQNSGKSNSNNNSGSGSSNNSDDEDDYWTKRNKSQRSTAVNPVDSMSEEEKEELKDMLTTAEDLHKAWEKAFKQLSDAEKECVKSQLEHIMKEAARSTIKSRGNIPSELSEIIDNLLKPKPPVFNWKQYFRRILGVNYDINTKKTRRKESLRFPDSPGLKKKKKHNILVAIDTSGSINMKEFQDFFSEIYHIYKAGASIHILECDASISNEYDYKGVMPKTITGRGGTSFIPVVNYYNENKSKYTCCVYFTDGYGDQDECTPLGKMIWIISSDGDQKSNYPGFKVCIPKKQ